MRLSHVIALMFWASMTGSIVVEVGLELPWAQSTGFAGLTAVLFAGLAFGWVLADAKENDIQVPGALKIGVVMLAAVAAPYYKFRYFGPKSGILFIGVLILCLILTVLLSDAITALVSPGNRVL